MSGLGAEGPGIAAESPRTAGAMEGALSASPAPEVELDHESDDEFQYEEVEVPR